MSVGLISKKYLIDCANAIRAMLNSEDTYTPTQMATAIALIDGTISGTITKSSDTNVGLITDTLLDGICDALRTKLDDNTLSFTPSQIADAILSIESSSSAPEIVSFASGTDEQIAALIDYAHSNQDFDLHNDAGWSVGDVRSITVGAFTGGGSVSVPQQSIDIVITSFDEYMSCGNKMQFDFKDALSSSLKHGSNNSGGYGSSLIKTVTLPALVDAMPTWLKDRLIEFSCLASAGSGSSTIQTITGNKLALRSEIEIYGTTKYSVSGEGSQISYYATSSERKKKKGHSGSFSYWWERSPKSGDSNSFCAVDSGGDKAYTVAYDTIGIAPFGCL